MQEQQVAKYSCTRLVGVGKQGILRADKDGYREVLLGGYGIQNSVGAYYDPLSAGKLLESSSAFQRRVSAGYLRGEYGHPKPDGMNERQWMTRVMRIEETRESHHIKSVTVIQNFKGKDGKPCMAVIGMVKPTGPYGHCLEEKFENGSENLAFSVRSITSDSLRMGRVFKVTREIVTWDYVNEPGIAHANKFDSPSMESLQEVSFTKDSFYDAVKHLSLSGFGLESSAIVLANDIERAMGWKEGTISARPMSSRW